MKSRTAASSTPGSTSGMRVGAHRGNERLEAYRAARLAKNRKTHTKAMRTFTGAMLPVSRTKSLLEEVSVFVVPDGDIAKTVRHCLLVSPVAMSPAGHSDSADVD
jgi:hypothetical protein